MQRWVRDLNTLYRGEPALHELDCDPAGFEWIDCNDAEQQRRSCFLRKGKDAETRCWSSATSRRCRGTTTASASRAAASGEEMLNSDAPIYGGSGQGNLGGVEDRRPIPWHGRPYCWMSRCRRWES